MIELIRLRKNYEPDFRINRHYDLLLDLNVDIIIRHRTGFYNK